MLFNSLAYMCFLPIVFVLYWAVPHRYRSYLLLFASYYFYMSWNAGYLILIIFTTLLSYFTALLIERTDQVRTRKLIASASVLCCLLILFFFKYFNFMADTLSRLLSLFSITLHPITLNLLLPVGISFYTFQTLSYVIDVYRGRIKAERNIIVYATFVSFFPQLVAGPIERSTDLLPQIRAEHRFNEQKAIDGLKLMLCGYYKKLLLADSLSVYVDTVYDNLSAYKGFDLLLVIFFFTIQIYCDFSGYSDIAIGTARLLDIDLMTNFRSPYFAASIKEFWSRWHISLSTWFRDYLYIPLGGNRCGRARHYFNLLFTFLVSGLWHGASLTFIFWGAVHGLAQILETMLGSRLERIRKNPAGAWLCRIAVFAFCNFTWVLFRAQTGADALYVFRHAFDGIMNLKPFLISTLMTKDTLILLLSYVLILAVHDYMDLRREKTDKVVQNKALLWAGYVLLGLIILFGAQKGVAAEFVYFQF